MYFSILTSILFSGSETDFSVIFSYAAGFSSNPSEISYVFSSDACFIGMLVIYFFFYLHLWRYECWSEIEVAMFSYNYKPELYVLFSDTCLIVDILV